MQLTSFGGLLQVTVNTHAGETENSGLNHLWRLIQLLCLILKVKYCCCEVSFEIFKVESTVQAG